MARPLDPDVLDTLTGAYPSLAARYFADSSDPDIIATIGRALVEAQHAASASAFLERAAPAFPSHAGVWGAWAAALSAHGAHDVAAEKLDHAIQADPRNVPLRRTLGRLLNEQLERPSEAAAILGALAAETGHEVDYELLAFCFVREPTPGRMAAGVRGVLGAAACSQDVLNGVAECLLNARRYEEAAAVAEDVTRVHGPSVSSLCTQAWALTFQGDPTAASPLLERAVELGPGNWRAAWSRFCNLHTLGEFQRAREVFSGTVLCAESCADPRTIRGGDSLHGRTVLFHQEHHGFGDAIQFGRFAAWLKERGARVLIVGGKPVTPLLAMIDGVDAALTRFDEPGAIDRDCGPGWPWVVYQIEMGDVSKRVPFIHVDESRVAAWRRRIDAGPRLAVGIAWEANDVYERYPRAYWGLRSVPFLSLAPLMQMPDIRLCSLQKGAPDRPEWREFPPKNLVDVTGRCADLGELAAAIAAMDAIVTADTVVAHIAGGLGKPTWVMLNHVGDWRWGVRGDSPWYPTVRLVRQTTPGVWRTVVSVVAQQLQEFARLSGGAAGRDAVLCS